MERKEESRMIVQLINVLLSCFILVFSYYTLKLFVFWFCKKVLKIKKLKDMKFKLFGEEL